MLYEDHRPDNTLPYRPSLTEDSYEEINAELKELAARQAAEEEEVSTNKRIFIGSGEDGDHASQYFKTIHVVI